MVVEGLSHKGWRVLNFFNFLARQKYNFSLVLAEMGRYNLAKLQRS